MRTLYFTKQKFIVGQNREVQFLTTFGVHPRDPAHEIVSKPIRLKDHLAWHEVRDFQKIMADADFWDDFPEPGVHLISAEAKAGDEAQRIDLLYLRSDGRIFPCELKLGGVDVDSPGQLVRYLGDLDRQPITKDWVLEQRRRYLERKEQGSQSAQQNVKFRLSEFEEKISQIPDEAFQLVPNYGVIIDEEFPSALVSTVVFLNGRFRFAIRLVKITAHVADDWTANSAEYVIRLTLADQPAKIGAM